MVVPLIVGKVIKDLSSGDISVSSTDAAPMIIGFFAAFIAGLVACKWMIALVKKSKLTYFAIYCAVVGISTIIYTIS